jgi:hypothetical protein
LIDQDLTVAIYDFTTVDVTGQTDFEDDVRAYGMAKSGLVELQFMLSFVQTAEGLPIAHEVHPGNTAEAKTLLPMIRGLLARYPLKRMVLIADRGLRSTANIEELGSLQEQLKKDGRDVAVENILAVPAAHSGDFADDLKKPPRGAGQQARMMRPRLRPSRRCLVCARRASRSAPPRLCTGICWVRPGLWNVSCRSWPCSTPC